MQYYHQNSNKAHRFDQSTTSTYYLQVNLIIFSHPYTLLENLSDDAIAKHFITNFFFYHFSLFDLTLRHIELCEFPIKCSNSVLNIYIELYSVQYFFSLFQKKKYVFFKYQTFSNYKTTNQHSLIQLLKISVGFTASLIDATYFQVPRH